MKRNAGNPTSVLTIIVLVLLVLSLAPSRLTSWVGVVRGPATIGVAPIAGVLQGVSQGLRPARQQRDPEEVASIEQSDRIIFDLRTQNQNMMATIARLEARVEELSRMRVATGIETRAIEATRVGSLVGSGAVEFRPGARAGVEMNAVAIAPGSLQVIGLVSRAQAMTSTVHMITDTRFEPSLVAGVVSGEGVTIESTAQLNRLPRIDLRASGRGTLVAENVEIGVAERLSEGDTVRVLDDGWPLSAQLLVLGEVTRIADTDEPLFKRVVVTPLIEPSRVRSVTLRMPLKPSDAEEGGS